MATCPTCGGTGEVALEMAKPIEGPFANVHGHNIKGELILQVTDGAVIFDGQVPVKPARPDGLGVGTTIDMQVSDETGQHGPSTPKLSVAEEFRLENPESNPHPLGG